MNLEKCSYFWILLQEIKVFSKKHQIVWILSDTVFLFSRRISLIPIKRILTFDNGAFLRESPLWVYCEHPSDKFWSTCLCFVCNYGVCKTTVFLSCSVELINSENSWLAIPYPVLPCKSILCINYHLIIYLLSALNTLSSFISDFMAFLCSLYMSAIFINQSTTISE